MADEPTFDQLLDEAAASDLPTPLWGNEIYDRCTKGDAELAWDGLNAWMWDQAEKLIGREVQRRRGLLHAKANGKRGVGAPKAASRFSEALDRHRDGRVGLEHLTDFALLMRVSDDGDEKTIGELTSSDHMYVADRFQGVGESSLMLAAIHRQVGRLLMKNPSLTTADAMSQDQYRVLVGKISGLNTTEIE